MTYLLLFIIYSISAFSSSETRSLFSGLNEETLTLAPSLHLAPEQLDAASANTKLQYPSKQVIFETYAFRNEHGLNQKYLTEEEEKIYDKRAKSSKSALHSLLASNCALDAEAISTETLVTYLVDASKFLEKISEKPVLYRNSKARLNEKALHRDHFQALQDLYRSSVTNFAKSLSLSEKPATEALILAQKRLHDMNQTQQLRAITHDLPSRRCLFNAPVTDKTDLNLDLSI